MLIFKFCSRESIQGFWQLGDELRGHSKNSDDHEWLMTATKLAEQTMSKGERRINLDLTKGSAEMRPMDNYGFQEENKFDSFKFNTLKLDAKMNENVTKSSLNAAYQNPVGLAWLIFAASLRLNCFIYF